MPPARREARPGWPGGSGCAVRMWSRQWSRSKIGACWPFSTLALRTPTIRLTLKTRRTCTTSRSSTTSQIPPTARRCTSATSPTPTSSSSTPARRFRGSPISTPARSSITGALRSPRSAAFRVRTGSARYRSPGRPPCRPPGTTPMGRSLFTFRRSASPPPLARSIRRSSSTSATRCHWRWRSTSARPSASVRSSSAPMPPRLIPTPPRWACSPMAAVATTSSAPRSTSRRR